MKRKVIFNNIVQAFGNKFSWLGEDFAKEFLLSCASYNIQEYSKPEYRVRRHLLLFWEPGWLKSALLTYAQELLSDELSIMLSDITNAALRGTVEMGQFMSPYVLKRPFSICTEFGQIICNDIEIVQKLLNVLEEGKVLVSLAKVGSLSESQRQAIQDEYRIKFIDSNTFTYSTNWILMAGTYKKRFLVDNALQSRFNIIAPDKELTSELTRKIDKSDKFNVDEDTAFYFRDEIKKPTVLEKTNPRLPDAIYTDNPGLSPRHSSKLKSYVLSSLWWGVVPSKSEVSELAKKYIKADDVWLSGIDKVWNLIKENPCTVDEIMNATGLKLRSVYYALHKMNAIKMVDSDTGVIRFEVRLK